MKQAKKRTDWWKEVVVYQIYPRSFMDSNGDGIGSPGNYFPVGLYTQSWGGCYLAESHLCFSERR